MPGFGAMKQMDFDAISNQTSFITFNYDPNNYPIYWVAPYSINTANILLVGGGGGGGLGSISQQAFFAGGGGGAGGVIQATLGNLSPGALYTIEVGGGGPGGTRGTPYGTSPANGGNTKVTGTGLSGLLARGGGSGGTLDAASPRYNGNVGGSGGGGCTSNTGTTTNGNVGIAGQGNDGGTASTAGTTSSIIYYGGGGGGAGSVGHGYSSSYISGIKLRNGGSPIYSPITGANVAYAEGGGGAWKNVSSNEEGGYAPTSIGSGGAGGTTNLYSNIVAATSGINGVTTIQYTVGGTSYQGSFLVVGAGGNGGDNGGGGGAGGAVYTGNIAFTTGTVYSAVVPGLTGDPTTFAGVSATVGGNGGSNGGFGGNIASQVPSYLNYSAGHGGAGYSTTSGGSGGTIFADGNFSSSTNGGTAAAIGWHISITGTAIYYGGAGAGGGPTGGSNLGFTGGAGGSTGANGGDATSYGSGGGGGGPSGGVGGSGSPGVVILSVPTASYTGKTTGSPSITTNGSYTVITFTANGTYTA